jgi:amino acid transporter
VFATTSAFPSLSGWRTELCVAGIVIMTLANLRGIRDSGRLFVIPAYFFIASMLGLIIVGLIQLSRGVLTAPAIPPAAEAASATQVIGVLLLIRAFSSGCTAMTGVEAISNGIPAFRPPVARNAGRTLIVMAALLGTMFLGVSFLARELHLQPSPDESIISQIARLVFGTGTTYSGLQMATALILLLAANTSFADFPRLACILARDGYAPRQMAHRGDRLAFSNGIIALGGCAIVLVILSQGETHLLIPLYAVGVFLAFSLSQSGMVRHWGRLRGRNWVVKAAVNGVGAITTAIVLLAIVESKFVYGAWVVLILIPLIVAACRTIKRHYERVTRQLQLRPDDRFVMPHGVAGSPLKIVVPIADLHRGTLLALRFASSISRDVTAAMVDLDSESTEKIRRSWSEHIQSIPLHIIPSPYRELMRPLQEFICEVDDRNPARGLAVIVLPEFVPVRWWHHILHNETAFLLKTALLYHSDRG